MLIMSDSAYVDKSSRAAGLTGSLVMLLVSTLITLHGSTLGNGPEGEGSSMAEG